MSAYENLEHVIFASAARTATATSSVFENRTGRGVVLYLKITAASGTNPTLDITVEGVDAVSGESIAITGAAFATHTTTGSAVLTVYPGIAETGDISVSDVLPRRFQVVGTIGGTDTPTFTYSIGAVIMQ